MLSHPNIVTIYDVSVRSDAKYIVMEYIEGITLKNYMTKKGKLEFREIIMYTEQVLRALEHAHQKGIVHRDIKPQNIMLLKNGIIKVRRAQADKRYRKARQGGDAVSSARTFADHCARHG